MKKLRYKCTEINLAIVHYRLASNNLESFKIVIPSKPKASKAIVNKITKSLPVSKRINKFEPFFYGTLK